MRSGLAILAVVSTRLYKLGRACATHRLRTVAIWVVLAVSLLVANHVYGGEFGRGIELPGSDSERAHELLRSEFGTDSGTTALVVVQAPAGSTLADPPQTAAIAMLRATLAENPDVAFVDGPHPGEMARLVGGTSNDGSRIMRKQPAVSPDGTIGLISVRLRPDVETSSHVTERLEATGDAAIANFGTGTLRVTYGGDLYREIREPETGLGEAVGLLAAVVILLVAFGSIIAMGLPVGLALFGIGIGVFGLMGLLALGLPVPDWAPNMAMMIGLGVGIDYALFIVTRFREGLADGLTVPDAAGRANATAGLAVVVAGGTVVIAILGLIMSWVPFMTAAAVSVSMVVALMVAASITVLPALLGLVGPRLGARRRRGSRSGSERFAGVRRRLRSWRRETGDIHPVWHRWGAHVSAHARVYFVGPLSLLIVLSAPVIWLRLGFPDQGNDDPNSTTRQAYDLLAEGFGPGFNGPLIIAADTTRTTPAELSRLTAAVGADPGIAAVTPPLYSPLGDAATLTAFPTTAPQDEATVETLERLRTELLPMVLTDPDAAHIGGATATLSDVSTRVADRLPYFISAVVVLSFLMLMLVFRSLLVPLKAAILNLLSIGAAYGVMVAVFQWGWGLRLVGLAEPVPIVSFLPMFTFAMLFGLSMDYEVFLLSRIRENYLASGDNAHSVVSGIANTARVITSAALIMISVFIGFVSNADPVLKMMGLSLATAIAIDATVIRMVLVPASMKLLGDANWWFPRWLARLPSLHIDGERRLPPREYVQAATEAPSG